MKRPHLFNRWTSGATGASTECGPTKLSWWHMVRQFCQKPSNRQMNYVPNIPAKTLNLKKFITTGMFAAKACAAETPLTKVSMPIRWRSANHQLAV